jgi:hypothetical protein
LQFDDYAGWVIATNRFNQRLSISFPSASAHGLLVNYDFQNAKLLVNELNGQVTAISRQKNFFEEPSYRYGLSSDIYEWSVEIPQVHEVSMQVLSALLSNQNYPNISDAILNTKYAMLCILSSKHSGKTVNLNDFQGEKIETRWP